jgi:hypothetical protein
MAQGSVVLPIIAAGVTFGYIYDRLTKSKKTYSEQVPNNCVPISNVVESKSNYNNELEQVRANKKYINNVPSEFIDQYMCTVAFNTNTENLVYMSDRFKTQYMAGKVVEYVDKDISKFVKLMYYIPWEIVTADMVEYFVSKYSAYLKKITLPPHLKTKKVCELIIQSKSSFETLSTLPYNYLKEFQDVILEQNLDNGTLYRTEDLKKENLLKLAYNSNKHFSDLRSFELSKYMSYTETLDLFKSKSYMTHDKIQYFPGYSTNELYLYAYKNSHASNISASSLVANRDEQFYMNAVIAWPSLLQYVEKRFLSDEFYAAVFPHIKSRNFTKIVPMKYFTLEDYELLISNNSLFDMRYVNDKHYDHFIEFQQKFGLKMNNFIGCRLTGKQFNQIIKNDELELVKILNDKENHYGFQYNEGKNEDDKKFNPYDECMMGGLYFTNTNEFWHFSHFGNHYRQVTVPDDVEVYVESKKYKATKIVLGAKYNIPEYSNFCSPPKITFKNGSIGVMGGV